MSPSAPLRAALLLLLCSCGSGPDALPPGADARPPAPDADPPLEGAIVDLLADVNRDGVVDAADEDGEETWTAARGAIFLANLDDDQGRCPPEMYPAFTPDDVLAACHDAADEVVNGADDLADLARLRTAPWPDAPDDAVGTLAVAPEGRARLFRRTAAGSWERLAPGDLLAAATLREGMELAIEARDIVRDRDAWDGLVDVTLAVGRAGSVRPPTSDRVRLRVAPVVLFHHLLPAQRLFVTKLVDAARPDEEAASDRFRADLAAAGSAAGVPEPLHEHEMRDRWMQDLFESGYMSMPAAGGGQHVIRVALRTPFLRDPDGIAPLRVESRIVFFMRGRDHAVIQQYSRDQDMSMQTLNSFGNTETIPPYEHQGVRYPLGRLLRGSVPDFFPDPTMTRLLDAQAVQPPVAIDTSWLMVAHVDETVAFVPAGTPRGWVLVANDPGLAREMLLAAERDGHGEATLFTGRKWRFGNSAEVTVSQVLADVDLMTQSAIAAAEVEAQVAVIKAETGLGDHEIVRVPYLHEASSGRSLAYQPGTANLVVLSRSVVLAPDPAGPIVNGKDIFKTQLEEALAPHGITVRWLDVWDLLHRHVGEVHCGTNATRAIPDTRWWEAGR